MTGPEQLSEDDQIHAAAKEIAADQWARFGYKQVPTGDSPVRRPRYFTGPWMTTPSITPRALLVFAASGFALLIVLNLVQRKSWDYNIEWYLGVLSLCAATNAAAMVAGRVVFANRTFRYRLANRNERLRWERFLRRVDPADRAALFRLVMAHRLNADEIRRRALHSEDTNPNVIEAGDDAHLKAIAWAQERRWFELHAMRDMLDQQMWDLSGEETCQRPGLLAFYTLYPYYEWEHRYIPPEEPADCAHDGELRAVFAFSGVRTRYLWVVLCLRCAHRWQQTDVTVPQHVLDFVAKRAAAEISGAPPHVQTLVRELARPEICTARYMPAHRFPKGYVFCEQLVQHDTMPHRTFHPEGHIAHEWNDDDARASHGPIPQPGLYLTDKEEA